MSIPTPALGLRSGKIPAATLGRLLSLPRRYCPELVVPPSVGEDAAVLDLPGGLVAVTSDPITFPTLRPGHVAVCVNANDVAVMGARPRYFTLTILLPPGISESALLDLVADAIRSAEAYGVTLIGGHTEVTSAVTRPVLAVTMFGELVRPEPLRTGGAQAGDALIQVGYMALEGTAILASEHGERLRQALGADDVAAAAALLESPGISVVAPALALAQGEGVHALHDPTEGGLATGLREMAVAAGLGAVVEASRLLLLPVTERVCGCLGYEPLGLISSGCLLAAAEPRLAEALVNALHRGGHGARVVGQFSADPALVLIDADGRRRQLPEYGVDELAR